MALDPKDPKVFNLNPAGSDMLRTGRRRVNPHDIERLQELSAADARTIINDLEADIARLTADGDFGLVQSLRLRRDYISLLQTQLTAHKEEVSIIQKMLDEAIAEERQDRELGRGRFESQASARAIEITYRQLSGGFAPLTSDGGIFGLSTVAWENYNSFAQIQAEVAARYWDGTTRMAAEEHRQMLDAAVAATTRRIEQAWQSDPARAREIADATRHGTAAIRDGGNRPDRTLTPEQRAEKDRLSQIVEEESLRIAREYRELMEQLRQNRGDIRDPRVQERLRRLGEQLRAMQETTGTMGLAADPEQFHRRMQEFKRHKLLTDQDIAEMEALRKLATAPDATADQRRADQEALRRRMLDYNLRFHVAEGNITEAEAERIRGMRTQADALPSGSADRDRISRDIRGLMGKAWKKQADKEAAEFDADLKAAQDGDESAINRLEARARRLAEVAREMQKYNNVDDLARAIVRGQADITDLYRFSQLEQQRARYEDSIRLLRRERGIDLDNTVLSVPTGATEGGIPHRAPAGGVITPSDPARVETGAGAPRTGTDQPAPVQGAGPKPAGDDVTNPPAETTSPPPPAAADDGDDPIPAPPSDVKGPKGEALTS